MAGRPGQRRRAGAEIRCPARHCRRSPGSDAQGRRQGGAERQPGRAGGHQWRQWRGQHPALERRRPQCGGDVPRDRQQGSLDRQRRPCQRQAAATPSADRPGVDQLGIQRLRLEQRQPHPVVPVRTVGTLAPVHATRCGQAGAAHLRQLGSVRAGARRRWQRLPVPVQPQAAGRYEVCPSQAANCAN